VPLQNRVDPWGRLHAVSARGTLLGNRGILHNARKEIIATSARKGWVTCRLEFEVGTRRRVRGLEFDRAIVPDADGYDARKLYAGLTL
jgi:hypothetical protein